MKQFFLLARRPVSHLTRSLVATALIATFCGSGARVYARPDKPDKASEIAVAKIKVPIKVGESSTKMTGKKVAIGEQFRLWMSVNASDCNDPLFPGATGDDDHKFEAYGELKVNGKSQWKVNRAFAHQFPIRHVDLPKPLEVDPRKQGFTLNADPQIFMDKHEILFDTNADGTLARIALKLTDKDDPNADTMSPAAQRRADKRDDLIGDYKIDLDLGKLGARDGHYYWFWKGKDENGNAVGTELYLFAEHVKTIYGTGQRRKPEIDPKIVDKKIPGKPGGPGPVVRKPAPATTK